MLRRLIPTRDDQSGSITPFVLIVTIALFMLAGLVIDGGRQMNSRSRAVAYAQEASRAGATAIDLTRDIAVVDRQDAEAAAARFCESAMARDDDLVECEARTVKSGNESGTQVYDVEVSTTIETEGILSGMFNVDVWTAHGLARARPVQGVTEPQSGQQITVDPPETAPPTGNPFPTGGPEEPTGEYTKCKKPYWNPYDPDDIWHKGEPPLDPPISEPLPTADVFCWPPWTPKTKEPPEDGGPGPEDPEPEDPEPEDPDPEEVGPNEQSPDGGPNR